MPQDFKLFAFKLNGLRYALPLAVVERVIASAEITPMPGAPMTVAGVINVQGMVIPVLDMRKRLLLPEKELELSDKLILVRTDERAIALVADAVEGVVDVAAQDMTGPGAIYAEAGDIGGVARLKDGMVILLELNRLISKELVLEMSEKEGQHA